MAYTKSFTLSGNFSGGLNPSQLYIELTDIISTELVNIRVIDNSVDIVFATTLSGPEETLVDNGITSYIFKHTLDNFTKLLVDDNNNDLVDTGSYNQYVDNGITKFSGYFRDASDNGRFKFFNTTFEPRNTVNDGYIDYNSADLQVANMRVDSGITVVGGITSQDNLTVLSDIIVNGTVDGRNILEDGNIQDNHIANLLGNPHNVTLEQIAPTINKGELMVDNGVTVTKLDAGINGQVLAVKSTTNSGLTWTQSGIFLGIGVTSDTSKIWDQKSTGTNGGQSVNLTWVKRELNNIDAGLGPFVTLGVTSQFTILEGKYVLNATIPSCGGKGISTRLQNITDSTTIAYGTNEFSKSADFTVDSHILALINITSTTIFEIQQYTEKGTPTTTFGRANGFFGIDEFYTNVQITKVFEL